MRGEKKSRKRRANKDDKKKDTNGASSPPAEDGVSNAPKSIDLSNLQIPPSSVTTESVPATPGTPGGDGALDPIAKKIRNLNKKVNTL